MKKIMSFLVIGLLVMLPFMVNAKENVEITNVKLLQQKGSAEVGTPTFEGLTVNFDVKFAQKDDEVIYKVTIKNNDTKSYELDKGEIANSSKHIKYTLNFDGSGIIKPKATKDATISIKYFSLVNDSEFVNGRFVDNDKMVINLRNESPSNPKTSSTGLIILLVIGILLTTMILFKATPKAKMLTVLALAVVLPFGVLAATKIQIKVNSKVEIVKLDEFCVLGSWHNPSYKANYYKFVSGMTWKEYKESSFANIPGVWVKPIGLYTKAMLEIKEYTLPDPCLEAWSKDIVDEEGHPVVPNCLVREPEGEVSMTDVIKDKTKACYSIQEKSVHENVVN